MVRDVAIGGHRRGGHQRAPGGPRRRSASHRGQRGCRRAAWWTTIALIGSATACSSTERDTDDGATEDTQQIASGDPPETAVDLAAVDLAVSSAAPFDRIELTGIDELTHAQADELVLWMLIDDVEAPLLLFHGPADADTRDRDEALQRRVTAADAAASIAADAAVAAAQAALEDADDDEDPDGDVDAAADTDADGDADDHPVTTEDAVALHLVAPFHPLEPFTGGTVELRLGHGDARGPALPLAIDALARHDGALEDALTALGGAIEEMIAEEGATAADLAATDFADAPPELLGLKLAQSFHDDGSAGSLVGFAATLSDDDRALADAIVAAIGLTDFVASSGGPTGLRSPQPSQPSPLPDAGAGSRAGRSTATSASLTTPGASPGQATACVPNPIRIDTAQALATAIAKGADWEVHDDGPLRTYFKDLGTVTTFGGFLPLYGPALSAMGGVGKVLETIHNFYSGVYPTLLTDLDVTVDRERFFEDFTEPGTWSGVLVTAESTGWNAGADFVTTALAWGGAVTSAGRAVLDVGPALSFASDLTAFLATSGAGAFLSEVATISVCPHTWVVDVSDSEWTRVRAIGDLFVVDADDATYEPGEVTPPPFADALLFEVRPERFSGRRAFTNAPVSVSEIMVRSSQRVIDVTTTGEPIEISGLVFRAEDPGLDWHAEQGAWLGAPESVGGTPHEWRHTHVTAGTADAYPYLVTIESTSTTGLRANSTIPRRDVIRIQLQDLYIVPETVAVPTGGATTFEARDRNGNPVDASWSGDGGSIDSNGVYTAGDVPGMYTIFASEGSRSASATVFVFDPTCVAGTWVVHAQTFFDYISSQHPTMFGIVHTGGRYVLEFDASGAFTGRREDLRFTVPFSGLGPGGESGDGVVHVTIDSVETGIWGISHEPLASDPDRFIPQLWISESSSNANVTVTVLVNGMELPLPAAGFDDSALSGSLPFECGGDVLTVAGVVLLSRLD